MPYSSHNLTINIYLNSQSCPHPREPLARLSIRSKQENVYAYACIYTATLLNLYIYTYIYITRIHVYAVKAGICIRLYTATLLNLYMYTYIYKTYTCICSQSRNMYTPMRVFIPQHYWIYTYIHTFITRIHVYTVKAGNSIGLVVGGVEEVLEGTFDDKVTTAYVLW